MKTMIVKVFTDSRDKSFVFGYDMFDRFISAEQDQVAAPAQIKALRKSVYKLIKIGGRY